MELVIVGANAAGLAAALEARRRHREVRITVLDAAADISWSTCDLPWSLTGRRDPDDLVLRRPADFIPQDLQILVEHRVERLDLARHTVAGRNAVGGEFELPWDRLILCSGARARRFNDGRGQPVDLPAARTLEDARRLSRALPRAARILVIGGGLIGLELLDCLQGPGRKLALVETSHTPLAGWPSFVGTAMAAALERAGVRAHFGETVDAIDKGPGTGAGGRVHLASGRVLDADVIINAAGIQPNRDYLPPDRLAGDAQGYLLVDDAMRTSHPGVYAAGDLVLRRSCVDGRMFRNPQALDARRGGRVAGANAVSHPEHPVLELPPGPGTIALAVFGLELARSGHPCPASREPTGEGAEVKGFWHHGPARPDDVHTGTPVTGKGPGLLGHPPAVGQPDSGPAASQGSGEHKVALVREAYPLSGHRGDPRRIHVQLEADTAGRLRAATLLAEGPGALRINVIATLLAAGAGWRELETLDLAYTPPLGPAVDPLIQAARRLGSLLETLEHEQGPSR